MTKQQSRLAIVCKTYDKDLESFLRFYASYKAHNVDNIPLYVSVPEKDVSLFSQHIDEKIIVSDESYAKKYFTKYEYWGLSRGYINQEICKLSFWENEVAENYLFVDSDAYFIRDFTLADFMQDANTPYSVLVMDKDLNTQYFYKEFSANRTANIKKIFDAVQLNDRRLLTCHGMTVMNGMVLKDFKKNYLNKNNMTYSDLIRISPYEYTWYNAWLQKCNIIKVVAVEPFFKTYHVRTEYIFSRMKLISESNLSSQYVGIVMNSNWTPKPPPSKYRNPGIMMSRLYKIINKVF